MTIYSELLLKMQYLVLKYLFIHIRRQFLQTIGRFVGSEHNFTCLIHEIRARYEPEIRSSSFKWSGVCAEGTLVNAITEVCVNGREGSV